MLRVVKEGEEEWRGMEEREWRGGRRKGRWERWEEKQEKYEYTFVSQNRKVFHTSAFHCCFLLTQVFPEAIVSQDVSPSHFLHSTLHIHHTSHLHTGTYHCNTVDGTDENENRSTQRQPGDLCESLSCAPFITASNPAVVTIIGESSLLPAYSSFPTVHLSHLPLLFILNPSPFLPSHQFPSLPCPTAIPLFLSICIFSYIYREFY